MRNIPQRSTASKIALDSLPLGTATMLPAAGYVFINTDQSALQSIGSGVLIGSLVGVSLSAAIHLAHSGFINTSYWKGVKDITELKRSVNSVSERSPIVTDSKTGNTVRLMTQSEMYNSINMPPYPQEIIYASAQILKRATKNLFNATRLMLQTSKGRAKQFAAVALTSGVTTALALSENQPGALIATSAVSTVAATLLTRREYRNEQNRLLADAVSGLGIS